MRVEELRGSFHCVVLDKLAERRSSIGNWLRDVGYTSAEFESWTQLETRLGSQPPHFLFLFFEGTEAAFEQVLDKVRETLPETFVFVFATTAQMGLVMQRYHRQIFDALIFPLQSNLQLVKSVDRAVQLNYQIYQNEILSERLRKPQIQQEPTAESIPLLKKDLVLEAAKETKASEETKTPETEMSMAADRFPDFRKWLERLYRQPDVDRSIQWFIKGVREIYPTVPFLFFRFLSHRRTLMATHWQGLDSKLCENVGLNFNDLHPTFKLASLRTPEDVPVLRELARELFKAKSFRWLPFVNLGDIAGLLLMLNTEEVDMDLVDCYQSALHRHCDLLELEKTMHSNSLRDPATNAFNRHTLFRYMTEEVSRSRRVHLPTSLVLVSLDQYFDVKEKIGEEEADILLRTVTRIFSKHSRITDYIGRVGMDELGFVLPHTSMTGAKIKAERLRRIIESADFSRVVKDVPHLTISLGISEYPGFCRDADELFASADQALYKLRTFTSNQIGLATVTKNFVPDFRIIPGKDSQRSGG